MFEVLLAYISGLTLLAGCCYLVAVAHSGYLPSVKYQKIVGFLIENASGGHS